jgi:hypothetical protein
MLRFLVVRTGLWQHHIQATILPKLVGTFCRGCGLSRGYGRADKVDGRWLVG